TPPHHPSVSTQEAVAFDGRTRLDSEHVVDETSVRQQGEQGAAVVRRHGPSAEETGRRIVADTRGGRGAGRWPDGRGGRSAPAANEKEPHEEYLIVLVGRRGERDRTDGLFEECKVSIETNQLSLYLQSTAALRDLCQTLDPATLEPGDSTIRLSLL
ncbi:hypothetical protein THAOC_14717, partial [Thalassiosira oceanica]